MKDSVFVASDLDRTIIPNGAQEESPDARSRFAAFVERDDVTLAYVSGRNKDLLQEAIRTYTLPTPDYAIGDVGTTIYSVGVKEAWEPIPQWEQEIAPDWNGKTWSDITAMFSIIPDIRLQNDSPAFQNMYKASYYTTTDIDIDTLRSRMEEIAKKENLKLSIIFSIDEKRDIGLLDILPQSATKLHAVEFLMNMLGYSPKETVFAGDSGNDLPVLASSLQSVLVKNAREDVRKKAVAMTQENGTENTLYIARGGFLDMNGNYSAGVLEGIAHFLPHTTDWMN